MIGRRILARLLDIGLPVVAIWAGAPGLVVLLLYWLYEMVLTARSGQTIGKRLTALRVVGDAARAPGLGRSAVRASPILVLGLPFVWPISLLTYAWALRPDRRGLHDLAAGTRVVGERWIVGDPLSR